MTGDPIRAAVALLGWSAGKLAERAGVHIATVQRMERATGRLHGQAETLCRIEDALRGAGVDFLKGDEGPGVRLKRDHAG